MENYTVLKGHVMPVDLVKVTGGGWLKERRSFLNGSTPTKALSDLAGNLNESIEQRFDYGKKNQLKHKKRIENPK